MRRSLSTSARTKIFLAANGACHICGQKIQAGEAWDVEHVIPIAMGGEDGGDNLKPAHARCHKSKTKKDVGDIAKAKRREAKHRGAYRSANPLPFGRSSKLKRKINGEVVRRDDED